MDATPQRERVAPSEAGFSINFHIEDPVGCDHQVTMRSAFPDEWGEVFKQMKAFKTLAQEHGWALVAKPKATPAPPPVNKAAEIMEEAGATVAAAEQRAADQDVPASSTGKPYQTVDVSEIHITPKPDGRIELAFWNPGRKWPEEHTTCKPERAAGLLKHVTSADVSKAQKLACRARVYFTIGKEKQNGGNWHDIEHVRPI